MVSAVEIVRPVWYDVLNDAFGRGTFEGSISWQMRNTLYFPRYYLTLPVGGAYPEKKHTKNSHARQPKGPELGSSFKRAQAKRVPQRALLAERHARGPDGQRMRSLQLARCSRDQIRQRMAALARG